MEFLGSALIVFAIIIGVAVAAVSFEPANPLETWHRLVQRYGTVEEPAEVQYPGQAIRFGSGRAGPRPLNPLVTFDVSIDDVGLWIVGRGSDQAEHRVAIRVPGTHVRPASRTGKAHVFELFAEPPVKIAVGDELGSALLRKCQPGSDSER